MCEHDYRVCRTDDDLLQFDVHGNYKWGIEIKKVIVIDKAFAIDSGPASEVLSAYTHYVLYLIKNVAKNLGLKDGMFLRGKHKTIRIGKYRYTDAQTILTVLEGINKYEKRGLKLDVYDQYLLEFRYQAKQNENKMPIEELISVFRKKDSFEEWFAERIEALENMTEELDKLTKARLLSANELSEFESKNPKYVNWCNKKNIPYNASANECVRYLHFLNQYRNVCEESRRFGVACEYYTESIRAMIKMLTDAANTHYKRLTKRKIKELNLKDSQEVKDFFIKSLYNLYNEDRDSCMELIEGKNNCIEQIKHASEPYYTYQRN